MLALLLLGAAPPPALDDSHDLVVLHPKRPVRVRLHVRVGGEPFPAPWMRQVGALFRHLDLDGDGKLSPLEAALAPSREQWSQILAGEKVIDPDPAPPFADLAKGKKFATADDLASWYGSDEAGPLRAKWQASPDSLDVLSDRLWELLRPEAEPWHKLTTPLVKAAPRMLEKLDRDEDEMLTPGEILGDGRPFSFFSPPAQSGPAHGPAIGGMPFFSLRPGEPTGALQTLLRKKYKSDTLGQPDAVIRIDLGGAPTAPRLIGKPTKGVTVRPTRAGLLLGIEDWMAHVVLETPLADTKERAGEARRLFKSIDRNKNGYLDKEEIYSSGFKYVSWQRLADRNRNGQINESEFVAFSTLLSGLRGRTTAVRVDDLRQSLFRLFDTDGDGRLSRRELVDAWKLLGPGLEAGFTQERLPRVFRLSVGLGRPDTNDGTTPASTLVPPRGPVWFQRMDRNRDGDVSRAEWLGDADEFDSIDKDKDGLISVEEAEAWDRRKRK